MFFRPSNRKDFTLNGLKSYARFCKPWRFNIVLVAVVFILANVVIAIQPLFLGKLVDAVTAGSINHHDAWLYAILLIATSSGHNVLWRAAEFLYRGLLFPISFHYETFLFRTIINRPYPYFVDKFTGKIGSYVSTTSNELRSLLDNAMFDYIGSLVSIITVIAIMTSINLPTGLIIIACLACMLAVGKYTLSKDMAMQKIEADYNSTKNGHIVDSIANFVSVKSFFKERREVATVEAQQGVTLAAGRKAFFWGIMFWGTQSIFVRDIMWTSIVLLNLWMLLRGEITVGEFTTVISTALLFTQSIWEVVWNISQAGQRISRLEEAHRYLFGNEVLSGDQSSEDTPHVKELHDSFEIGDLSFAYPDDPSKPVLTDISITLKRGEKIGIVGKSGSGKSTLVKLLLDHYRPSAGYFKLDGKAVASTQLKRLIAYVPQDTSLFHRTIAENISYGSDHPVSREQIVAAAQKAQAHEFISKLLSGYDTVVGERGVKLSGGQRQRIAIARAMLDDKPPIIVLDEATSALDSESEKYVQQALESLWQDKTVIAIAHRLSTLRTMDRIFVMEDGKIVESGSHRTLVKSGGIYAELWSHQSGGFIEE